MCHTALQPIHRQALLPHSIYDTNQQLRINVNRNLQKQWTLTLRLHLMCTIPKSPAITGTNTPKHHAEKKLPTDNMIVLKIQLEKVTLDRLQVVKVTMDMMENLPTSKYGQSATYAQQMTQMWITPQMILCFMTGQNQIYN